VDRLNHIKLKLGDKLYWFTPTFKVDNSGQNVIIGVEIDMPVGRLDAFKKVLK